MQYAESAALRELMYRAYATRASDEGDLSYDNGTAIARIMALRRGRQSCLRPNHAEGIAGTENGGFAAAGTLTFIRDIACGGRSPSVIWELEAFAAAELGIHQPGLAGRRLTPREGGSSVNKPSDEKCASISREDRVLAGPFRVVENNIYSVRIVEGKASAWHPDVRFLRGALRRGKRIGEFYLTSTPATASGWCSADLRATIAGCAMGNCRRQSPAMTRVNPRRWLATSRRCSPMMMEHSRIPARFAPPTRWVHFAGHGGWEPANMEERSWEWGCKDAAWMEWNKMDGQWNGMEWNGRRSHASGAYRLR